MSQETPNLRRGQSPRLGERAITIFERSRPGRRAFVPPEAGVPELPLEDLLPASQRRERQAELPEVSEPELVRHYVTLSAKNFRSSPGCPQSSITTSTSPVPKPCQETSSFSFL